MVYSSDLVSIVKRLNAMREDKTSVRQVRHFDVDGQERCVVLFDGFTRNFKLIDPLSEKNNVYEFDDIDHLAVEIFERLQPRHFKQNE